MNQRIKTLCAGGVLALALFGVAAAGPLDEAKAAAERGDYATEMRLIRPLAEQGNAIAQSALGFMYDRGQGVPQDYPQAAAWYRKAAEQGNANAQGNLGSIYLYGRSVPQDYAQAAAWYRKAAEQGDSFGQAGLGTLYGLGLGVPKDDVQAHMWLNLAAAGARIDELRKTASEARNEVASKMTPAQIATAQRMASEWKPK
jgi:uncharacterized protein